MSRMSACECVRVCEGNDNFDFQASETLERQSAPSALR